MGNPRGTLARITVHPVKSLDGIDVESAPVLTCGALADDRRWRLVDLEGRVVNAKRTPRIHAVRASFDLPGRRVRLSIDPATGPLAASRPSPAEFLLVPGAEGPCGWLAEALGLDLLLEERAEGGFPDDRDAPGPTLAAAATLDTVARWFGLSTAEARRRFRVNLEVAGPEAFWEDTLAAPARREAAVTSPLAVDPYAAATPAEPLRFAIGSQCWLATGVCRRCPVPGRDSRTGRDDHLFREVFEARRRTSLRAEINTATWTHTYRLAINTLGLSGPGSIRIGDLVTVLPGG
ncbi:MAG: MOSC N-terminal beta barrel domain-containing protein [Pirellulales bacterium]